VPRLPFTPEVEAFLLEPNPAVVGTLGSGGPHTVPTWYAWEDGLILLNMDESRARLEHLRNDPRVSLTVLQDDWYHHVSMRGRIVRMADDDDLAGIDRLSQRYRGRPYRNRERKRVNAWMEVEHWDSW
jgi:PPOX class probable F420-dependent enzyme